MSPSHHVSLKENLMVDEPTIIVTLKMQTYYFMEPLLPIVANVVLFGYIITF